MPRTTETPRERILMRPTKLGLILTATLTLVLVAPTGALAQSVNSSPTVTESSDGANLIASDPDMRYVSLAEAVEQYGFDPAAESIDVAEDTGPAVTPLHEWWGCEWEGRGDYPHVSNGQASVHGYWVYLSGSCPSTADVTVNLKDLGCSPLGCTWITQATDTAVRVTPGSGTGHWATPHKACASSRLVAWQGEIYTGLTDFWHPYGPDYGPARDLSCSPA